MRRRSTLRSAPAVVAAAIAMTLPPSGARDVVAMVAAQTAPPKTAPATPQTNTPAATTPAKTTTTTAAKPAAAAATATATDPGWPRTYALTNGTAIVYQPQVSEWDQ